MDGHFISRSTNGSYLSYTYSNPALLFNFDRGQSINLQNATANFRKEGLSFVLENVRGADGKRPKNFDSIAESSADLRPLIGSHEGDFRVRELTGAEKQEIEAFKKTPDGK